MKYRSAIALAVLVSIAGVGALAAITACGSGPNLPSGGSDVTLVNASSASNCAVGCGFIGGFALGSSGAYLMYASQLGGPTTLVDTVDFTSDTVHPSKWASTGTSGTGTSFDIAADGAGSLVWADSFMATSIQGQGSPSPTQVDQLQLYTATEAALPTLTTQQFAAQQINLPFVPGESDGGTNSTSSLQPYFAGFAADANAVYVAYTDGDNLGGGGGGGTPQSPDTQAFAGAEPPSAGRFSDGAVARIDRANPNAAPVAISGFHFAPADALHLLAQDASNLYFADLGLSDNPSTPIRILAESKASFGSQPTQIASLPRDASSESVAGWIVVGIAANATTVAWSAAPLTANTAGGNGNVSACRIYATQNGGPAQTIFGATVDGTIGDCSGLAIDDQYAYVALTSPFNNDNGTASANNGNGNGAAIIGTGIARVPLAGGPPQIAQLQSQKWYGPRRVFVDATYVYAIDPTYVVRFSKTDFR